MSETLKQQLPAQPEAFASSRELLFAQQMRGIVLHVADRCDVQHPESGFEALHLFNEYADRCYPGLSNELGYLNAGEALFIEYWNSFIPETEEDDVSDDTDDFPMWLEYDDDGQHTPLEEWYGGGETDDEEEWYGGGETDDE